MSFPCWLSGVFCSDCISGFLFLFENQPGLCSSVPPNPPRPDMSTCWELYGQACTERGCTVFASALHRWVPALWVLLGLGSQSTQKSVIIPFYEEEVLASVSSYHSPQPPFKEKAELKFKSSPPPSETHKTHYFTARPVPLEGGEQEAPEASFLPGGKGPSGPRYSQELNVPQTRFSPAGRGDVYKSCATARWQRGMALQQGRAKGPQRPSAWWFCIYFIPLESKSFYIHFASFSANSTKVLFPTGNVHPCGPAISSCLTSDFTGVLPCLQGGVHNGVTLDGGVSTRPQNQCNEGTFYIFWKAHPQSRVCGSVACFHILRAHRDGRCQRIPLRKKCPSQKRS